MKNFCACECITHDCLNKSLSQTCIYNKYNQSGINYIKKTKIFDCYKIKNKYDCINSYNKDFQCGWLK